MNGKGISIVSLILAVLAIVMAVGMPLVMPAPEGEVGPQGPQGDQGPPGPGLRVFDASLQGSAFLQSTCEQVMVGSEAFEVTIPAGVINAGDTVVVTVTVVASMGHPSGGVDWIWAYISQTPDDCTPHDGSLKWRIYDEEPDSYSSWAHTTLTFQRAFYTDAVPIGPQTFYVNAVQEFSGGSDRAEFVRGIIVAIV